MTKEKSGRGRVCPAPRTRAVVAMMALPLPLSAGDAALRLERHGEAKPFEIRGGWTQRVKGTVTIRDGKLSNPRFRWEDRD